MKANTEKLIDFISSALILHVGNVAPISSSNSSGKVLAALNKSKFNRKSNKSSNQPKAKQSADSGAKNADLVICKYCSEKVIGLKFALGGRLTVNILILLAPAELARCEN